MSHFNNLSIFNGQNNSKSTSSQDKDDQSFEKWMQQARLSGQTKQRQINTTTAANQDPSTLNQGMIEEERFSRISEKTNTAYILHKRIFAPSRPESDPRNSARDKGFTYSKPQSKSNVPPKFNTESDFTIPSTEEELDGKNKQDPKEENAEADGYAPPKPRDSLKLPASFLHTGSNTFIEPDKDLEEADEKEGEENNQNKPDQGNAFSQNLLKRVSDRSEKDKNSSNDDDEDESEPQSNQSSDFAAPSNNTSFLFRTTRKKESDHRHSSDSENTSQVSIAGVDPLQLVGLAAELLLDKGPFGRMTRSIGIFCANNTVNSYGIWETYIAIDQKILPETTLFMRLSPIELLLRFKTTHSTSAKLIQENEKKLYASLTLILEQNACPRVINIVITDY